MLFLLVVALLLLLSVTRGKDRVCLGRHDRYGDLPWRVLVGGRLLGMVEITSRALHTFSIRYISYLSSRSFTAHSLVP
jgi:hypothetical protein